MFSGHVLAGLALAPVFAFPLAQAVSASLTERRIQGPLDSRTTHTHVRPRAPIVMSP